MEKSKLDHLLELLEALEAKVLKKHEGSPSELLRMSIDYIGCISAYYDQLKRELTVKQTPEQLKKQFDRELFPHEFMLNALKAKKEARFAKYKELCSGHSRFEELNENTIEIADMIGEIVDLQIAISAKTNFINEQKARNNESLKRYNISH